MKKICIALDVTPAAEQVAKVGYEYAEALGAEVVLIHVLHKFDVYNSYNYDPFMGYDGQLIQADMDDGFDLETEAQIFLESTARFIGEPDLKIKILSGNAADEILHFTTLWQADLLVIGTHSHSILEDIVLGNIAVKIVKHSKIPLMVIPVKA